MSSEPEIRPRFSPELVDVVRRAQVTVAEEIERFQDALYAIPETAPVAIELLEKELKQRRALAYEMEDAVSFLKAATVQFYSRSDHTHAIPQNADKETP